MVLLAVVRSNTCDEWGDGALANYTVIGIASKFLATFESQITKCTGHFFIIKSSTIVSDNIIFWSCLKEIKKSILIKESELNPIIIAVYLRHLLSIGQQIGVSK